MNGINKPWIGTLVGARPVAVHSMTLVSTSGRDFVPREEGELRNNVEHHTHLSGIAVTQIIDYKYGVFVCTDYSVRSTTWYACS